MSRVGNKPIDLPKGVSFEEKNGTCFVKGPKGALEQSVPKRVAVAVADGKVVVTRNGDTKQAKSNHGLLRALLQNMVTGVNTGWTKKLEIQGVGYSAEVEGQTMTMRLGYSHPVVFPVPEGISIEIEKGTKITIAGIDRAAVGHTAAVIRGFRKPDAYKGKGIRYADELVRLKPGKAGATA